MRTIITDGIHAFDSLANNDYEISFSKYESK